MIGVHLGAFPPSGSSVDDVGAAFTTVKLQPAERVATASTQAAGAGMEGRCPGGS